MRHHRSRVIVAGLALAAMLSACSSGSSNSASSTPPPTSTGSPATSVAGSSPAGSGSAGSGSAGSGAADSSVPQAPDKAYTIAYGNVMDASPLFKLVGDNMVSDGEKLGYTVKRYDNAFDASKVLSNAQLMVQQKPDLIVDWIGVDSIGKSVGTVFSRAKTPCIAVNQQIEGCAFFNLVNAQLGQQASSIAAKAIKDNGWTAADTTVVFLFTPGAGDEVNSNGRYFYSFLAKELTDFPQATPESITDSTTSLGSLPNFVQVNGGSALEPSYTAMKNQLQVLPKGRHLMIFTQNDDSALGAWRAITQQSREADTLIIGQGANADGLKQLRTNPSWIAEGSVFFEYWPHYLLAMATAMLGGATPPALTLAPQVVMSKDTVAQYYGTGDHPIKAPELPKENEYLLSTGILQKLGTVQG